MSDDDIKPDTWMPVVIGSYLKHTSRLTTEQHGAYWLLQLDYWISGPPPDDDAVLAVITKLDPKAWRRARPALQRFFVIEAGVWRHVDLDRELADWAERKRRYAARASLGGKAKAAKSSASSTATSTPKAVLAGCSPSPPREVDGPSGQSTLSGGHFLGPIEVRAAFVAAKGEEWVASYIDGCGWHDVPERALLPATATAATMIRRDARALLSELGIVVQERAA